jgi:hypothetical protein
MTKGHDNMTVTLVKRRPSAMIRLDRALTDRALNLRTGRREIWAAGSADRVWLFRRVEMPGTPWETTHLPTGLIDYQGTLKDARSRAADPRTLQILREQVSRVDVANGALGMASVLFAAGRAAPAARAADRVAEQLGLARRAVAVLDGRLVAAASDGICLWCDGLLAGDVHADECPECFGGTVQERRACRLVHRHQACPTPEAAPCDHGGCRSAATPAGGFECELARDRCCGCCADRF